MKPLPPYGKQFLLGQPDLGPWVCTGSSAWEVAKTSSFPRMVMPDSADPADFRWPVEGEIVTVVECGIDAPESIRGLAHELIGRNGAEAVIALRSVGGLMTFVGADHE